MPPLLASLLTSDDYERLRQGLLGIRDQPEAVSITKEDLLGASGVFLLVFLSTFPVVVPFMVFRDVHVALRASNAVAIAMMFMAGYWLARHGGYHPLRTGASVVVLGVLLVGIAIALGG